MKSRPIVAEKTLTKMIVPICLHGGGSPAERAHVAAGLIISRICDAYGVTSDELAAA